MCLVAQVVRAPVQCSEGCEQHNLAVLPMNVCLAVSVHCSFYLFCRPVLLDYLVAQLVRVPDPIRDTFIFFFLIRRLVPSIYSFPPPPPQNIRNIRHTQKYLKFSNPKHIFQYCTLTLRKALKCMEMTPQKIQKIFIISPYPKTY